MKKENENKENMETARIHDTQPDEDIQNLFPDQNEAINNLIEIMDRFYEGTDMFTTRTDMPVKNIKPAALGLVYGNLIGRYSRADSIMIDAVFRNYFQLRVSTDRKGRSEMFNSIKYFISGQEEQEPRRGILSRLIRR